MVDKKKLRTHLEAALACLGDADEGDAGTAPEETGSEGSADEDLAVKSMKMKLSKYKDLG